MKKLSQNPSSFRDPQGYIITDNNGNVYRTITSKGQDAFLHVEKTGLYDTLIDAGKLVSYQKEDISQFDLPIDDAAILLSHPKLPFISYPYEWTFEQLRQAALLHLDIHLESLAQNITLSDATAYNIQFIGSEPTFIDLLSFQPYEEGMFWKGQQQFVEQFLNPLLLWSYAKVPYNDWYRGSFSGIPSTELNKLVPTLKKFSFRYLNYISLPCYFEKKHIANAQNEGKAVKGKLPKEGFIFILKQLRKWISTLKSPHEKTVWGDYAEVRNYNSEEVAKKHEYISNTISKVKPKMVWDIGCNTGEFSFTALEAGAEYVVGLEMDHGALAQAFAASEHKQASFLPIYADLLNPSSEMGWNENERSGIKERSNADFVLSLAVIHHLVIGGNIPLENVVQYLTSLGKSGIIEWVPKSDSMVKRMLLNREDIFADYDIDHFEKYLSKYTNITDKYVVSGSERTLFYYK